jgi:hypothetical protein
VPLARNFGSAELDIEAEAILGPVITGPHAIFYFSALLTVSKIHNFSSMRSLFMPNLY